MDPGEGVVVAGVVVYAGSVVKRTPLVAEIEQEVHRQVMVECDLVAVGVHSSGNRAAMKRTPDGGELELGCGGYRDAAAYTQTLDRLGVLRGYAPVKLVAAQLHAQLVEGVPPRGMDDPEVAVRVVERMSL